MEQLLESSIYISVYLFRDGLPIDIIKKIVTMTLKSEIHDVAKIIEEPYRHILDKAKYKMTEVPEDWYHCLFCTSSYSKYDPEDECRMCAKCDVYCCATCYHLCKWYTNIDGEDCCNFCYNDNLK